MIDRRGVIVGLAGTIALPFLGTAKAQTFDYPIIPTPCGDGLWAIRGSDAPIAMANGGAIANITVIKTEAGAILVDCGPSLRYGKALKAAVERLTGKAVIRVYLTHLHPDHIYGAGAFDPAIVAVTPRLSTLLASQAAGFSDGMYRLLGDWMRGTEFIPPGKILDGDHEDFGGRRLRVLSLNGHSPADLAILDEATGTLIPGDLVFHDRAPSTPHANLARWRTALGTLKGLGHRSVIPGHGPLDPTPTTAIDQTLDWLNWLEASLRTAVADGQDMVEAGEMAIPERFADVKAARYELQRSVSHLYPGIEAELFPRIDTKR